MRVRMNEKNPEEGGSTLLIEAAKRGNNKCVSFLIDRQANLDVQNDAGHSALTIALSVKGCCHDGTAQILVNAGASLDYADVTNGKTALLWAVSRRRRRPPTRMTADAPPPPRRLRTGRRRRSSFSRARAPIWRPSPERATRLS